VTFDPCIAVLALPSDKPDLPGGNGIVRLPDDDVLDLVADNRVKGISRAQAVTIHATGHWSRAHWDDADETVGPALLALARDLLGTSADVVHVQRWRYSAPSAGPDDLAPGGTSPGPIRFAGDAFAGGRVEGAALSGSTAAHRLLDDLS
jgi:predicted NAD/FAD-dependent oxidoreductase